MKLREGFAHIDNKTEEQERTTRTVFVTTDEKKDKQKQSKANNRT